jgi:hypothetical protein
MPQELIVESTIYNMGKAAGERRVVELRLRRKLGVEAPAFVQRLPDCGEERLTELVELLISENRPRRCSPHSSAFSPATEPAALPTP